MECCKIGRGRVISADYIRNNSGEFPVYSSQSFNSGILGYIKSFDFNGKYVTWTTDGAYAGSIFYREGKFNCTNVCGTLKILDEKLIKSKYLAYILGSIAKSHVNYNTSNPKLMNNMMANIEIPIPSLETQNKIVSILDKFDTIVNDIKEGLPKEIELRHKAYEYYRNKLLTFPSYDS